MSNYLYCNNQNALHPDWLQFLIDEQQKMWIQHWQSNPPVGAYVPLSGKELYELEMYRQYLDNLFTMDEMANHVIRTTNPRFTPPPSHKRADEANHLVKVESPPNPTAPPVIEDDEIEFLFEKEGERGSESRKWIPEDLKKKKKRRKKRKVENPPSASTLPLVDRAIGEGANKDEQQMQPILSEEATEPPVDGLVPAASSPSSCPINPSSTAAPVNASSSSISIDASATSSHYGAIERAKVTQSPVDDLMPAASSASTCSINASFTHSHNSAFKAYINSQMAPSASFSSTCPIDATSNFNDDAFKAFIGSLMGDVAEKGTEVLAGSSSTCPINAPSTSNDPPEAANRMDSVDEALKEKNENPASSSTPSRLIDASSTTAHDDLLHGAIDNKMDEAVGDEEEDMEEGPFSPIDASIDNYVHYIEAPSTPFHDDINEVDEYGTGDGEETLPSTSSTHAGSIAASIDPGGRNVDADAQMDKDEEESQRDEEEAEDVIDETNEDQVTPGQTQRVLRSCTRSKRPSSSSSSSSDTDSESDYDREEEKENDEDAQSGSMDWTSADNIVIPPSKRFSTLEDRNWEKKVAASEKYAFTSRNVWICKKPKKQFLPDPSSDTCESLREARIACPVNCPARPCMNNFLRKPNMKMFIGSTEYGNGIFAAESFRMKDGLRKILEYTGEIRTNEQWKDHIVEMKKKRPKYGRYVVQMSGFTCDPEMVGNSGRMSNHSCDPNCMLEVFYVDGIPRLFLIPLRDIDEGEQLVWFYGGAFLTGIDGAGDKPEEIPCKCGAANCQGIVGGRFGGPTKIVKKSLEPEIKEKRKRTRTSNIAEEAKKQRKEEAAKSKKIKAQKSSRGDRAEKRSSNI